MTDHPFRDRHPHDGIATSATYEVAYAKDAQREVALTTHYDFLAYPPYSQGSPYIIMIRCRNGGRLVGNASAPDYATAMAKARELADADFDPDPSPVWWQGAKRVSP